LEEDPHWKRIRGELETGGKPILAYLEDLEEPERSEKWEALEKFEHEATLKARLKKGIPEFLDYLEQRGIKRALVTNNSRKNVDYLLDKFQLRFDSVLTRESGLWKPSGRPFTFVMERLRLRQDECCVIGDSLFDIQAAEDAGIDAVFILSRNRKRFVATGARLCRSVRAVRREIEELIRGDGKARQRS
jgi:HAD superfamily hydrolase (TIGR01509 family)